MTLKFRQQTFTHAQPIIYLIGTPIGNRQDFPSRMRQILNQVDIVLAEDTRTSRKLLGENFSQSLVPLHKFNEIQQLAKLKKWILEGKNLAIISDAGVPLISDPGALVLDRLREELPGAFAVTALNAGPAFVHASVISGLGTQHHYFHGFLKSRTINQKTNELSDLIGAFHHRTTIAFYESVHRLASTITLLEQLLDPQTEIAIARELTKLNEEVIRGPLQEIAAILKNGELTLKGEFVVLIAPRLTKETPWDEAKLYNQVKELIGQGQSLKQATQIVSDLSKQSKNKIYQLYLKKKAESL